MFIGHYGPALAIKRRLPRAPLWLLFVAVQWVDLMFFALLMLGIEEARLTPGFTDSNPYDLYYMPYTHSLLGAVVWAALFGSVAARFGVKPPRGWAAGWLGLAAFSHFVLDAVVHVPDLQLAPGIQLRMGLGLWNHRLLACLVETLVFGWGLWSLDWWRNRRALAMAGVGTAIIWIHPWVPTPPAVWAWAIEALVMYGALAYGARWVEDAQPEPVQIVAKEAA